MCPTDCIRNDQIPSTKAHGAKRGAVFINTNLLYLQYTKKQVLAWTIILNHRDMTVFIKEW